MRCGKGLVQVNVHGVHTKVCDLHSAQQGVEVCTVAVKKRAVLMQYFGCVRDFSLKKPARIWVRKHHCSYVVIHLALQVFQVNAPVCLSFQVERFEPAHNRCCGIGAMCRRRYKHNLPLICFSPIFNSLSDTHHTAQLSVGTSSGRHCHSLHSSQLAQPFLEAVDNLESTLSSLHGLEGVDGAKAGVPGYLLIHTRIVLHRARAKRIDPLVNVVVQLG
mmetsp:Transcript_15304/g.38666  ORF Transcript_15304/g.38666 Transcript_15304/m.38666 type:complete len:218 (+) Transcript_15304:1084-1737(+)